MCAPELRRATREIVAAKVSGVAGLEGKRAIVTGASSGIGAATTAALREAGATVYTGSRREGNLDVVDPESCRRFVDAALEQLGGLEILVNNAGLSRGRDPVWESKEEDEREVVETNVLGLMRMTRLCLPHLVESELGHIVNLGSVAGRLPYPNAALYVASKFAVRGFTYALREDLLGRPIRLTTVDPGLVETNFSRVRFRGDEDKAAAVYRGLTPLRPEDVADCIVFALTRPTHVNIDEIVVKARDQSTAVRTIRDL